MVLKRLPIGRQSIEFILQNNYLYVDKTEDIYRLITNSGGVYFLSRPRRFGKSLLISTLEQIFLGNKGLFKDLWIYRSDYNWHEHPVIRLDMSKVASNSLNRINIKLNFVLNNIARLHGVSLEAELPELKFEELIYKLYEVTGKAVVILIDEYDKPILDNIGDISTAEAVRDFLREFYTVIKSNDQYLQFVFITGVSKFSRVSVFSGFNNLQDLSMSEDYAKILGITQNELETYFAGFIEQLAQKEGVVYENALQEIKSWYNGYRFSENEVSVYNPFSTLQLLENSRFSNYWFSSGTPTFLLEILRRRGYKLEDILGKEYIKDKFDTYEISRIDAVPILFQTGYLTIKDYIKPAVGNISYVLDFPNKEVRNSFTMQVLDVVTNNKNENSAVLVNQLIQHLNDENLPEFFYVLKILYANIPYDLEMDKEKYFQIAFHTLFTLLGAFVETEVHTNDGRIDAVVHTNERIYVLEFKLDGSAKEALEQIRNKEYATKYERNKEGKKLILLGVSFDTETRTVKEYEVG